MIPITTSLIDSGPAQLDSHRQTGLRAARATCNGASTCGSPVRACSCCCTCETAPLFPCSPLYLFKYYPFRPHSPLPSLRQKNCTIQSVPKQKVGITAPPWRGQRHWCSWPRSPSSSSPPALRVPRPPGPRPRAWQQHLPTRYARAGSM